MLAQFVEAVANNENLSMIGDGLTFSDNISEWYGGPEVVAHGTSMGAPSLSSMGFMRPLGDMDTVCPAAVIPPPQHGDIPGLPPDVLAAATALTRPIPTHPQPAPSFDLSAAFQFSPIAVGPSAAGAAPTAVGPQYTYTVPLYTGHDTSSRSTTEQDAFIAQMFAGGHINTELQRQFTEARFGTDPNFDRPSNQPPTWEPLDSIRSQQDAVMGSFHRIDSAAPTRAPSPVVQTPAPAWPSSPRDSSAPPSAISQCPPASLENNTWPPAAPPPKKRKTSGDGDPIVKREVGDTTSAERWKSPSLERQRQCSEDEPPNGEPRKRRKSKTSWGTPKVKPKPPPRENLTEEQKRANHIRSEQKRRTAIKEDYEELFRLVPTVRIPGPPTSKSHVLNEAYHFIKSLTEGNDRLEARLVPLGKTSK